MEFMIYFEYQNILKANKISKQEQEKQMKNFKIGDKITRIPLIQGGMGVGISLGRLAGSVAKEGGVGVISTAADRLQRSRF